MYPDLFSEQQVVDLITQIRAEAVNIGQNVVRGIALLRARDSSPCSSI